VFAAPLEALCFQFHIVTSESGDPRSKDRNEQAALVNAKQKLRAGGMRSDPVFADGESSPTLRFPHKASLGLEVCDSPDHLGEFGLADACGVAQSEAAVFEALDADDGWCPFMPAFNVDQYGPDLVGTGRDGGVHFNLHKLEMEVEQSWIPDLKRDVHRSQTQGDAKLPKLCIADRGLGDVASGYCTRSVKSVSGSSATAVRLPRPPNGHSLLNC
jgi:hypothetical protein